MSFSGFRTLFSEAAPVEQAAGGAAFSVAGATSVADATNAKAWRRASTAYSYRNAADLFPAERAMLRALGAGETARAVLLDIGVGTGRTTGHLAGGCARYVGIDYSAEMIARAQGRFPDADLRVGDVRTLADFADGTFDVVVFSYNGLDYVDHDDRLLGLAQIRRVLRPGGAFLFSAHRLGVAIPSPWSMANLRLGASPVTVAKGMARYVAGICNASRVARRQQFGGEHALLNDSAQRYMLLTYYITPAAQRRQLHAIGFDTVRAFAQDGAELAYGAEGEISPRLINEDDYMVHYLARRA